MHITHEVAIVAEKSLSIEDWNRSVPTGHKIVRVQLQNGKVVDPVEDFATGWLAGNGNVTGRPTGVTFGPDGTLFVSDDSNGVIYHIWYQS